jgi:hypothetical protein
MMGTTTTQSGMEMVLSQVGEILAPAGPYELKRSKMKSEIAPILAAAKAVTVIDSPEQAQEATSLGRLLQTWIKERETLSKDIKQKIDLVKAPVLQAEHDDVDPAKSAKLHLGTIQSLWEQRVLREKEEADRKSREESLKKAQEDQLLRAIEHESIGDMEGMEEVLKEDVVPLPAVTLSRAQERPTGSVTRGVVYKAKVTNLMDLVKAIAAGKAPLSAVLANESFLNNQATQFKEAYSIPGTILDKSIPPTSYRR